MNRLVPLALLAVAVSACSGDARRDACTPGEPIGCPCPDGSTGDGVCGAVGCACATGVGLAAEPNALDFGAVPAGTSRDAVVLLRNPADRAVAIAAGFVGERPEPFALPDGVPASIPAGGSVPLTVRFDAVAGGSASARLRVVPGEGLEPLEVPVAGEVPDALLSCRPTDVFFPDTWVGVPSVTAVSCTNAGPGSRLALDGFEVAGEGFSAGWLVAPPSDGLDPGEYATLEVRFAPVRGGAHQGTLAIRSTAGLASIVLGGQALATPECDVELPESVRLSIEEPGDAATYDLAVRNRRADAPCILRAIGLCPGTDPAFSLPDVPEGPVVIAGGDDYRFSLRFEPGYRSCHDPAAAGCLEFLLEPATEARRTVPLTCEAPDYPPAPVFPAALDFGEVTVGCGTADRTFELNNVGTANLRLEWLEFGPGTSGEFLFRSFPPPGTVLPPGASAAVTVAYRPLDRGEDASAVYVQFREEAEPRVVRLRGLGGGDVPVRDTFRQATTPQVDLLFVIDNGVTMGPEAARLVPELAGLPAWLAARYVDFRLAVTTTGLSGHPGCPGGASGGEDGRFFPVDGSRPRILDPATPELQAAWEANLAVGTCQVDPPQALEAAVRALTRPLATVADDPRHPEANDGNLGFLRLGARLEVVVISDRVDASPVEDEGVYAGKLQALKGAHPDRFAFDAVTGDRSAGCHAADGRSAPAGDRLVRMAERTGAGRAISICGDGWIEALLSAAKVGMKTCFYPSELPADLDGDGVLSDGAGELRVLVDGVEESSTVDGEPRWWFSPEGAVCFDELRMPSPGQEVELAYVVSGCGR